MAKGRVKAALLNIVASPHPEGVYERLFKMATRKPVGFWGPQFAAISDLNVISQEGGFYIFTVSIWVEVDADEPVIQIETLTTEEFPSDVRTFTEKFGVNARVFTCILDTQSHVVAVELKNEDGKTLSPLRAQKIFERLMQPEILGPDAEHVDVTLIADSGALDYILGLDRLDKLTIIVKRTNPDDLRSEEARFLARMEAENAGSKKVELVRASNKAGGEDGLKPDEEHKRLARVAAAGNGVVKSSGLVDGEKQVRSTKEMPRVVGWPVEDGESHGTVLWKIAQWWRSRRGDS